MDDSVSLTQEASRVRWEHTPRPQRTDKGFFSVMAACCASVGIAREELGLVTNHKQPQHLTDVMCANVHAVSTDLITQCPRTYGL